VSSRVVAEGTSPPSYDDLVAQLAEGETLHATWLRDPLMNPCEEEITDEQHFETIVAKTVHGYYAELKFEARAST
jgi:hypothetical protein